MITSAMSAWLKDEGLTRTAIGLFSLVTVSYSINFLWSPFVDRIRPAWLGLRRGWIFLTQAIICIACLSLTQLNIGDHLYWVALLCLIIGIASATQDIAIDAYRIDIIEDHEIDKLAAAPVVATSGWWTGYGGLGAIPFFIADIPGWDWASAYIVLGSIMFFFMVVVLLAKEPDYNRSVINQHAEQFYRAKLGNNALTEFEKLKVWLLATVVEPFREFFIRNGLRFAVSVLAFIFLFKMGEAFLGRMSIVFYKEIGFSNSDIGFYSKTLNWGFVVLFGFLGGMVNIRYGIFKGLFISGITMALSNLMFAAIAVAGPDKHLFVATIFIDGFTTAWSSVAMVAFISLLCNKAFSATQYALMVSLGNVARTSLSSASGFIVDLSGGNWVFFFILTAVMVIPSLMFLWSIRHKIKELEKAK